MKFPKLWFKSPTYPSLDVTPSWYLAWGNAWVDKGNSNITWCDNEVAIACIQPTFSPQQRFVVVGDVWLSNQAELVQQYAHSTSLEIVAHLWELKGIDCLNLLEGMFVFAVWD